MAYPSYDKSKPITVLDAAINMAFAEGLFDDDAEGADILKKYLKEHLPEEDFKRSYPNG